MIKIIMALVLGASMLKMRFQEKFIKTEAITYKTSDGISYKYIDKYYVVYNDVILYENDEYDDLSFCIVNDNIFLLIKENDQYSLTKYSLNGNHLAKIYLFDCYSSLKIKNIKGKLCLYGGIDIDILKEEASIVDNDLSKFDIDLFNSISDINYYQIDGFTLNLSEDLKFIDINIYRGETDEEINYIYINNNDVYFVGKKGKISRGIYGNGGLEEENYFVIRIEEDIKFRQIFSKNIENISFILGKIIIVNKNEIYVYNSDNSLISSLKMPFESTFIYTLDNFTCLCISKNKGYLLDLNDYRLLYEFNIEEYDFLCASDFLYFVREDRPYILDIIEIGDFLECVYLRYFSQSPKLKGIYGIYTLDDIEYDHDLEVLVFGSYKAFYKYKLNNLLLELEGTVIIEEEANVIDGAIYPLGYRLFFSGNGYLNGEVIYQNQEITSPGDCVLTLEGISETKQIKFKVSSDQLSFQDNIMSKYDAYGYANGVITIKIDSIDDLDTIIINDDTIKINKNEEGYFASCNINEGDNGYLIRYIKTLDDQIIPINHFFKVLGVKNISLGIDANIENNYDSVKVNVRISEAEEYLRTIILKIKYQGSYYTYYYPIGNIDIKIDDINLDNNEFSVYLGLYNGSYSYDLVKIFDGVIKNNNQLMQVKIINKQEYVNELAFLMNYQEGIKSIEFKDYYISLDKEKDYKLVIISSILGIVLMVLIIIFRCKRKFK